MRLGAQLYTVRDLLVTCPGEALDRLARIGYTEVEAFHDDVGVLAPLARARGLRLVSTHIGAPLITGAGAASQTVHQDSLRRTFGAMREQGIDYVGTYVPYGSCRHDAAFWTTLGERLNDAGEIAQQVGLRLVYHNHAVELTRLPDGRQPLDVLLRTWNPALIGLELDVFWASIAGADPLAVMACLGPRVLLLHLKDKASNAPTVADDGAVPHGAFVEVGAGVLPVAEILQAARGASVAHIFVEQDHCPGDPFVSLERSLQYVRGSLR